MKFQNMNYKEKLKVLKKALSKAMKNPFQQLQFMGLVQVMNEAKNKYNNNVMDFLVKEAHCWALEVHKDNSLSVRYGLRKNIKNLISQYRQIESSDMPKGLKAWLINEFDVWHVEFNKNQTKAINFTPTPDKNKEKELINLWKSTHDKNGNNKENDDSDISAMIKKLNSDSGTDTNDDGNIEFGFRRHNNPRHTPDGPELS